MQNIGMKRHQDLKCKKLSHDTSNYVHNVFHWTCCRNKSSKTGRSCSLHTFKRFYTLGNLSERWMTRLLTNMRAFALKDKMWNCSFRNDGMNDSYSIKHLAEYFLRTKLSISTSTKVRNIYVSVKRIRCHFKP